MFGKQCWPWPVSPGLYINVSKNDLGGLDKITVTPIQSNLCPQNLCVRCIKGKAAKLERPGAFNQDVKDKNKRKWRNPPWLDRVKWRPDARDSPYLVLEGA